MSSFYGRVNSNNSNSNNSNHVNNKITITIDFTEQGNDYVTTTIAGLPWVTSDSNIVLSVSDPSRAEEILVSQLYFITNNIIPGVGFDIVSFCTTGLFYGQLNIKCIEV